LTAIPKLGKWNLG